MAVSFINIYDTEKWRITGFYDKFGWPLYCDPYPPGYPGLGDGYHLSLTEYSKILEIQFKKLFPDIKGMKVFKNPDYKCEHKIIDVDFIGPGFLPAMKVRFYDGKLDIKEANQYTTLNLRSSEEYISFYSIAEFCKEYTIHTYNLIKKYCSDFHKISIELIKEAKYAK